MSTSWQTIAAITEYVDSFNSLALPYTFSNGVTLSAYPEWARPSDDSRWFSGGDLMRLSEAALALSIQYDASSAGDSYPDAPPEQPISYQEHAKHQIIWTTLALWLARPTPCAYEQVLHFERAGDRESLRQTTRVLRFAVHPKDMHSRLDMEDLRSADALLAIISTLKSDGLLKSALQLLSKALVERLWQSRYVFLWIVLEALFGAEDGREITFRLAQRAALLLGKDAAERRQLFRTMKEGYAWRSKLVHGGKLAKLTPEKSGELSITAESTVRLALNMILLDSSLRDAFEGKQRDEFLDELAFRA